MVKSRYKRDMMNPFWFPNEDLGFYSNYLEAKSSNLHRMMSGGAVSIIQKFDEDQNRDNTWLFADSDTIFIQKTMSYGDSTVTDKALVVYTEANAEGKPILHLYDGYRDTEKELMEGVMPNMQGRKIVYCNENSNNYDLFTFEIKANRTALAPSRPVQITYSEAMDFEPAWSPDGSRVAFVSQRTGNSDIFVMDLRTGEDQALQVTYHPMADRKPQWINEETLLFQSNRVPNAEGQPQWDIYSISIPK